MNKHSVKRVLGWMSSLHMTVVCLLLLSVLVFWGTMYQASEGLHAARERFFQAWFLLAFGFIPFPAVKTVVLILSANLLLAVPMRLGFAWRKAGLLVIHIGIAVLVVGATITHYWSAEYMLTLAEGQQSTVAVVAPQEGDDAGAPLKPVRLPVTVKLIDFEKKTYSGSSTARDYSSRLLVSGPGISREVVVSMNRPFRYGSYTFYQYSYADDAAAEATTLAVVRNAGRYVPYAASVAIAVGLLVHLTLLLVGALKHRKEMA